MYRPNEKARGLKAPGLKAPGLKAPGFSQYANGRNVSALRSV